MSQSKVEENTKAGLSDAYYEGMKVFWEHSDQFTQVKHLVETYFRHFKEQLDQKLADPSMTQELKSNLSALLNQPLNWVDLGSGDGQMSQDVLKSLDKLGYPAPHYEGVEPDHRFVDISKNRFKGQNNVTIKEGDAFDGSLSEKYSQEKKNFVTAFNSVYFVRDLPHFKTEVDAILAPTGIAIFVQSQKFTDNLGAEFHSKMAVPISTEVRFPELPDEAWDMLTSRKSVADIQSSASLTDQQKKDTMTTRMILEAMSNGVSTEEEGGQKIAQMYRERISSNDFGGVGRHVVNNVMLAYVHPNAPFVLKTVAEKAYVLTQKEICPELSCEQGKSR